MGSILGAVILFFLPDYYSFIGGEPVDVCFSPAPICIYEKAKREEGKELYAKYQKEQSENKTQSNENIYVPPLH